MSWCSSDNSALRMYIHCWGVDDTLTVIDEFLQPQLLGVIVVEAAYTTPL